MLIILLLGIILLGYLICDLFYRSGAILEKICLGFLLGSALLTILMFLSNWSGLSLSYINTLILVGIFDCIFLLLNIISGKTVPRTKPIKIKLNIKQIISNRYYLSAILILAYIFISITIYNLYWPVKDWDALTLYDFRGKVFAQLGQMAPVFSISRYYLAYPLYTSLLHTIVYISNINNPVFLYGLIYLCFIVLMFYLVKRKSTVSYSILFSVVLATTYMIYQQAVTAYTDFPYAVFLVLSYIYLLFWLEYKNKSFFIVSLLMVAFSTWIRYDDPFWVTSLLIILFLGPKPKKIIYLITYLAGILSVREMWGFYSKIQSAQYTVTTSLDFSLLKSLNIDTLLSRIRDVTSYYWVYVIKPQFLILTIYTVVFLIIFRKKDIFSRFSKYIVILNLGIVYGGIFLISLVYTKWTVVGDSVSRMSYFLTPLILYIAFIVLYTNLSSRRQK